VYAAFTQAADALLVLIDTFGEPEPLEAKPRSHRL
jgi:hypothetical protein